ncbi:ImmA/IrrE family metallo-endopeptidase [Enterococcus durans]|uniref:ImmA/IrrE family metallo-endopeptidase n=1 Tax=Enterococcus durans TaxID=53345 RepID=UPI000F4E7492|nr:ImmA/IrrE family metallo-endopeptidase [Enterococcus durans]KAA9190950.1 ImmA/IrrE family metallo-endopeptidase [Enterococcus durans]ROX83711.1 ImmA/IrrE family metallo-endopeptidase [Enterococcus durans]
MYLPQIDRKINELVKLYQTRNPFRIAKELKILVLEENIDEIYGYYSMFNQIKIIHINSKISDIEKHITCSHELGHCILHPKENTPMLSKKTLTSELKIEKEANYFATHLILDPSIEGFEYMSKYEKLICFGLPDEFDRFL